MWFGLEYLDQALVYIKVSWLIASYRVSLCIMHKVLRYLISVRDVRSGSGVTPEWKGLDNKMGGNNLGLSSCAVPRSTITCVVAYFRRTELLPGVSERSGID